MENKTYMTTLKERLSYWTYFVGQNVYYNITFIYLSAYLAMQGIALWKVSLVLLIVKVWDAVNDPLFGYIFDKVKFKNGLKSLPWLRIAVAFIPVVTIAVFTIPGGFGETGKLVWFAVAYLLWDTVYTLTDVPAYSMLNTMTNSLQERDLLLSVNRVFSGAGYLLCVVVMPLLISKSYAFAVIILSIFSALTMVPLCIFGSELYSILLNLLGMIPGVIAAMLMPTILKKLDKFKTLFWCNIVNVILGFVIYFVGYENRILFLVLTCIRAVPLCLVGVLAFMFTPDCAEYGQFKSGISAKGITFAIQTFSVKITGAVSSALALFLLGMFTFPKIETDSFAELTAMNIQLSDTATNGLWIVYALVPVIGMVISTFFYLGYKLNDKDVQIMAKCNSGEITREEAEKLLSRKY